MATCRMDGHQVTCPGGCGVLVDHDTGEQVFSYYLEPSLLTKFS
jgi:hypothetical protein